MRAGSTESAVAEVTVAPVRASPSPAVMMLTPPPSVRSAAFSVVGVGRLLDHRAYRVKVETCVFGMRVHRVRSA
jgi:hypothetical protein